MPSRSRRSGSSAMISMVGGIDLSLVAIANLCAIDRLHALHLRSWAAREPNSGARHHPHRPVRGSPAPRQRLLIAYGRHTDPGHAADLSTDWLSDRRSTDPLKPSQRSGRRPSCGRPSSSSSARRPLSVLTPESLPAGPVLSFEGSNGTAVALGHPLDAHPDYSTCSRASSDR